MGLLRIRLTSLELVIINDHYDALFIRSHLLAFG
jgi:hypothetical protein